MVKHDELFPIYYFVYIIHINIKGEHFAQPKTLVKIEHDESVNQGQTENKAGPSAGHIKDQTSNVQPQSEYIEKEITKKDGSPSQKGIYYGNAAFYHILACFLLLKV